jgi:hypothetical protein
MQLSRFGVFALAATIGLSGCGVAYYGAAIAVIATQKKTSINKTSAPDAQPTADTEPAFATLALSPAQVTVQRVMGTTTVPVTDFAITGFVFPPGYGQSQSNRDTGQSLLAGDRLVIRINGDQTQALTFAAADVGVVGSAIAATIVAKVQALTPKIQTVDPTAYTLFSGSFDPSTNSYTFVSGAPGETSEVLFEPAPRTGIDTVLSDKASTTTATRLGLGGAQGGIETSGAQSIGITVLNSGSDSIPSGTVIDLYLSHNKLLDPTALKFDKITIDTTVAVGEARRFYRQNGTAPPPATILRQDVTPGQYYLIFDVNGSNGETNLTNNTATSSHPIDIYQPVDDPALTTVPKVNALDFAITQTTSPIGLVLGQNFESTVTVTNLGAAVASVSSGAGISMGIDVILSADKTLDEPAVFADPMGVLAGVHVNPTDPNHPITILVDPNGSGSITASVNSSTVTVSFNGAASGAGSISTVQSFTDALNSSSGSLVDAFADGNGSPSTDSLAALLTAAKSTAAVAKDIFVTTENVTFASVASPLQVQSFVLTNPVRATAIQTQLLPVKLFPLFRIRPQLPTGGNPENTLNNIRVGANYVRLYNPALATFDVTTGTVLPSVNSDDFAALTAVLQRPVNTGSIRQGQQRVLSFQIPDTGLALNESQLLVILRTTHFDAHVDLLSSAGDLLVGAESASLDKTVVLYTAALASTQNPTFYLVIAPSRFDESDLAGGGETFELTISVNPRALTDIALVNGVNAENILRNQKQAVTTPAPNTENNVLVPFSLSGAKAEILFTLPCRARVRFRSAPVFSVGSSTVITQFLAGAVPGPLDFQAVLDETFNRIVYEPTTGDVNTEFLLEPGVYTVAFETGLNLPDNQDLRLEVDTQFIQEATTTGQ